MTTSINSKHSRRALWLASACLAMAALAGCTGGGVTGAVSPVTPSGGGSGGSSGGGGGTTVTNSPYLLYASNYVAYAAPASVPTNGAYLHSIQNGDVYAGFGGLFQYGCYSFDQPTMDKTQLYGVQGQANGDGTSACTVIPGATATSSSDYMDVAILAPGTNSTTKTAVTPFDISQSGTLLIQMGQLAPPDATHSNANVFTIVLSNDTSLAGDGSASTATCAYDQTLTAPVGPNSVTSAQGTLNYAIPLNSFTCTGSGWPSLSVIGGLKGSMTTLQSTGLTRLYIWISGDKNPGIKMGEFDSIAVGDVGFTM